MGTLPHLWRENPHENQTGHRGEKPHCVLPEVQEGKRGGYCKWKSKGEIRCIQTSWMHTVNSETKRIGITLKIYIKMLFPRLEYQYGKSSGLLKI